MGNSMNKKKYAQFLNNVMFINIKTNKLTKKEKRQADILKQNSRLSLALQRVSAGVCL